MRIGWATPFSKRSAIGMFSLAVCRELRVRGHEIDILRLEIGRERRLAPCGRDFNVFHADDWDLESYDRIVANFGNHAPYHGHVITLTAQRAPIGIFHDIDMRDFEWGLADHSSFALPRVIGREEGFGDAAFSDLVDPAARSTLATFAALTCGAVVHGPHYFETISAFCPGPVEEIPLCFPDVGIDRAAPVAAPGRRVAIFGVINENKQVGRVMEALALLRSHLGSIELHLIGSIEDRWRETFLAKAQSLGLAPPILHGYVSDDRLQEILERAQAICCLRYPVTEGGSASLVTALYRARPLIVSDVASFASVPDELVSKISYGIDPHDLAVALLDIFTNQPAAEAKAIRARSWAKGRFSARSYVDVLEPMLAATGKYDVLARTARVLVPAVTMSGHRVVESAAQAFAGVLDWMHLGQGNS